MLKLLSRIPAEQRKSVSGGLVFAAVMCAPFSFLMFLSYSESTKEECTGHLAWKKCHDVAVPMSDRLPDLLIAIGLVVFGLLCVGAALLIAVGPREDSQDHLQRYIAILHGHETLPVMKIASIAGAKPAKVREEIQSMIDSQMIVDYYIDYGRDLVVSKKYVPPTGYKTVIQCPHCRDNNEVIVGIPKPCSSCRQLLVLPGS